MKIETVGSLAAGSFSVAITWLAQMGLSGTAVVFACIGAALAVLELENRRPRNVVALLGFNVVFGVMAAPLAAMKLEQEYDFSHPIIVVLLAFSIAYVAHDVFGFARSLIRARLAKKIGGGK
ncbi:hypothetical protein QEZ52_00230 [Aliisedimentitalea scapharcae]|uniref:Holin n=1 Tax=Aliisedimentitalea scapharcae TaxID=1524259 RepID=A0ABZ2XW50_9RHOB